MSELQRARLSPSRQVLEENRASSAIIWLWLFAAKDNGQLGKMFFVGSW